MPKIKAIPQGMKKTVKDIYAGADNLNDARRDMEKIFMDLGSCFSGKVPELLLQRVMHMEKKYSEFAATLRKYGDGLNGMADQYESADEEGANKFNALVMNNQSASRLLRLLRINMSADS